MEEVIFVINEDPEGGYTARALGHSIFTEADTHEILTENIREAVRCHFDETNRPKVIRIHELKERIIAA